MYVRLFALLHSCVQGSVDEALIEREDGGTNVWKRDIRAAKVLDIPVVWRGGHRVPMVGRVFFVPL